MAQRINSFERIRKKETKIDLININGVIEENKLQFMRYLFHRLTSHKLFPNHLGRLAVVLQDSALVMLTQVLNVVSLVCMCEHLYF